MVCLTSVLCECDGTAKLGNYFIRVIRSSWHGFMKENSYFTNLVTFCNDRLGEGSAADIAHCDFSKDFDTLS